MPATTVETIKKRAAEQVEKIDRIMEAKDGKLTALEDKIGRAEANITRWKADLAQVDAEVHALSGMRESFVAAAGDLIERVPDDEGD